MVEIVMVDFFFATAAYIGIILLILIVGYQYILLTVYLVSKKNNISAPIDFQRFLLLIPAHNEELIITETLSSISKIEYPKDKFRTIVIADNCTDETINIVKSRGFEYIEHIDPTKRGKGYALDWALKNVSTDNMDAVVVFDADTKVSRNILSAFNLYLNQGFKAVQSANLVDIQQDNVFASIFALGNVIKNYYVYYPKFRMGSSAFLLGTGMCFHISLLKDFFREHYSISEDIEFSVRLIKEGIRIAFAHEAYVETLSPENIQAASTQRIRWGSGTFILLRKYFPFFLFKGIVNFQPVFIDTALTFLTWSKPVIGIIFILTLVLTFWANTSLLLVTCALVVLEGLYLCSGVILLRKRGHNCRFLLRAPFLIPWIFLIAVLGIFGFHKERWVRTDRS